MPHCRRLFGQLGRSSGSTGELVVAEHLRAGCSPGAAELRRRLQCRVHRQRFLAHPCRRSAVPARFGLLVRPRFSRPAYRERREFSRRCDDGRSPRLALRNARTRRERGDRPVRCGPHQRSRPFPRPTDHRPRSGAGAVARPHGGGLRARIAPPARLIRRARATSAPRVRRFLKNSRDSWPRFGTRGCVDGIEASVCGQRHPLSGAAFGVSPARPAESHGRGLHRGLAADRGG
jgi:hypothetical protein